MRYNIDNVRAHSQLSGSNSSRAIVELLELVLLPGFCLLLSDGDVLCLSSRVIDVSLFCFFFVSLLTALVVLS